MVNNKIKVSKLLTVTGVEEKKDKNGLNYKTISVSTASERDVVDEETGEVFKVPVKSKKSSFNVFEHNYLELSALRDELGVAKFKDIPKERLSEIAPDFGYQLEIGKKVEGDIITRRVVPYSIEREDGKTQIANTYTCVVLGNTTEEDFDISIEKEFTRRNHQFEGAIRREQPLNEWSTSISEDVTEEEYQDA